MDKRTFSIVSVSTTSGHVKGSENIEGKFNKILDALFEKLSSSKKVK
jgi:hypothetical protein